MKDDCLIFDFETLGEVKTCAAVCVAMFKFNEERFLTNPYNFMDIVNETKIVKFDVEEQVKKYDRVIEKSTLDWWMTLPAEARAIVKPSDEDVSISEMWDIFNKYTFGMDFKKIYSRGNSFDPIILEGIFHSTGYGIPYPFWVYRDTRTMIEGLSWGSGLKHSFVVDECKDQFVAHDARHDIAMDVMRIQTLIRQVYGDNNG